MYICGVNDFYLIFSSVTMVLAVEGHQMKRTKLLFICFNHYRWYDLRWITSLGMEKFHKRRMVQSNKRGSLLQFVDKDGHRVALADFAKVSFRKRAVDKTKGSGS
jgi:cytochrome c oxidase subunit 3